MTEGIEVQLFKAGKLQLPEDFDYAGYLAKAEKDAATLPATAPERVLIPKRAHWARIHLESGDKEKLALSLVQIADAFRDARNRECVDSVVTARLGNKKGGKKGGGHNRKVDPEKVQAESTKLLQAGTSPRDIAGKLAKRFGVSQTTIRSSLNKTKTE